MDRDTSALSSHRIACAIAVLALAATSAAWAQNEGTSGNLIVVPTASVTQTLTDNRRTGTGTGESEAITSLGAGLRITSRAGRLRGTLDYAVRQLLYARESSDNELQNQLQANLVGEVVPQHLYLSAAASVSQQQLSTLGLQTPDDSLPSDNRTEVRSLLVQPTLTFGLGSLVDARISLSAAATDHGDTEAGDSTILSGVAGLTSAVPGARLGWSAEVSRQRAEYDAGRRTLDDRATLGLRYAVTPELLLSLRAGAEWDDFRTAERERHDTYGASLDWRPTPRTLVSVEGDRRSFGHSHAILVQHRFRRLVLRLSDREGLNTNTSNVGATITAFELFDELLRSQEPDDAARAALVDDLLARNNLGRDSLIRSGFLTSAVTAQRARELSVAWQGKRTAVALAFLASSNERVDTLSTGIDDLVDGNRIDQRGLSLTVTHQLTPRSSLALTAGVQRAERVDPADFTELRSIALFWNNQLGRRSDVSLGLRHSDFSSPTDPYTENALIGNLRMRF